MTMLHLTVGMVLLIFGFSGCAWINQSRLADTRTEGRIVNNIYTSPQQSFRIRIPWLSTNATLSDERPAPNTLLVTIKDELCREFVVSERLGFLGTHPSNRGSMRISFRISSGSVLKYGAKH